MIQSKTSVLRIGRHRAINWHTTTTVPESEQDTQVCCICGEEKAVKDFPFARNVHKNIIRHTTCYSCI